MPTKPHKKPLRYDEYQKLVSLAREGSHPYVYFLGLRSYTTDRLLDLIRKGLSYRAFEELRARIGVSAQELAGYILISTRTLNRRKQQGRLEPDESDRLVRVSRIYALALQLFEGDDDAALDWLSNEQVGLGGAKPFDLVGSEIGAREVEALIGRLEHGVIT